MKVEIIAGKIILPRSATGLSGFFELKKWEKKTSSHQRKYYFGVLVKEISDYTGYSVEITHSKLGELFRKVQDKGTPYVESITKLTTKQMEEHNEKVRMWASETLELSLKLPNEIDYNLIEDL